MPGAWRQVMLARIRRGLRMRELYPDIEPHSTQRLAVDAIHTLHVEECGNPQGLPVVFLHGGPGAGISVYHRRFFDPARYRIVLFDQRGAGQSTPHAELRDNTTAHLVADIETIRAHLGIERWVVFGGSWGSTLALAYAQAHPQRVLGLVLRGIFLGRPAELRWFNELDGGAASIFPERWRRYLEHVPVEERGNMVEATGAASTATTPPFASPPHRPGDTGKVEAPRSCTTRTRPACLKSRMSRSAWRAPKPTTSGTRSSWNRTSCCVTSIASATSRRPSCTGATTSSAR